MLYEELTISNRTYIFLMGNTDVTKLASHMYEGYTSTETKFQGDRLSGTCFMK